MAGPWLRRCRMKILLVDHRQPVSMADGAAVYVSQLGPALAQEHRVVIVTVKPGALHVPGTVRAIRRVIASERPELVHLNNLAGLSLGAVLWAIGDRPPVVMSLHDYRLLARPRAMNRWLTGRVGLAISPSHYALDEHFRAGFFRQAIRQILPYGVEPGPRPPSANDPFVFRSRWPEPFPVRIQEALQSGSVVIASRVGGIPEMIRDGVNGLLVEPGDEAGIAAAIERLRESPELAARLRASALETARLYDMRFHIAHLTDAYRQLLTAARAGDLDRRAA
jgi:glycosyl transferase family 1/glycosyl transferase family 4